MSITINGDGDINATGNDIELNSTGTTDVTLAVGGGNVLVGKTSADFGVSVGMEMRDNDTLYVTRDGGASLNLNRITSDGNILLLQKDGSTMGSLGSTASGRDLHVNSTGGILTLESNFNSTERQVVFGDTYLGPRSVDNNAVDLGRSVSQFKDLYLSGGVYLGGTASSNLIDTYEEGSWTPSLYNSSGSSVSVGTASGRYTRIGNMITIWMYLYNVSASFQYITGHPAANNTTLHQGVGSILAANGGAFSAPLSTGPKAIALVQGNTQLKMDGNYFSGGQNIWLTMNYRAP